MGAIQNEDPSAAVECVRLCETLAGAEAFAKTDGLDAFLECAKGQNARGQGGLMQALAQALMSDMTDFKVAIFETIAAAGRWPSLRGRVAGSGVLGVVTATLLSPRHPAAVKALMVRLCALCTVDAPDTVLLGDPRRAEEFGKLRGQLVSSEALKAIVGLAAPGSAAEVVIASAQAIVAFAGVGSDVAARDVLAEAGAVSVLLAHLPPTEMDMPQTVSDSAALETVDPQTPAKVAVASEAVDVPATDEADVGNQTLGAVLRALAELALPAVACAPGADKVLRHLREPPALNLLRALLATQGSAKRSETVQVLHCLARLGRSGVWPSLGPDVAEDLTRLLLTGTDCHVEGVAEMVDALTSDRANLAQLCDLRPLQRALRSRSQKVTAAANVLQAVGLCDMCGASPSKTPLICGGCRKTNYCSQKCQKADWKSHKTICGGK